MPQGTSRQRGKNSGNDGSGKATSSTKAPTQPEPNASKPRLVRFYLSLFIFLGGLFAPIALHFWDRGSDTTDMAQASEPTSSKRDEVDTTLWATSAQLETRLEANRTCAIASDLGTGDCALPRLSGRCARFVMDDAVPAEKALLLRQMVQWLIDEAWGAGTGPPSVVDLHAGSISYKENFVDLYALMDFKKIKFTEEQIQTYNEVRKILRQSVSNFFGVQEDSLQHDLTFFSHINGSKVAKTLHDEYWHTHIDTEQYGTFAYTALLYLGTAHQDFEGGAFVFEDKPSHNAVEPRFNRLVSFTSDAENAHYADKVISGVRIAMTAAFTCNLEKANSIEPFPRKREEATGNSEVESS